MKQLNLLVLVFYSFSALAQDVSLALQKAPSLAEETMQMQWKEVPASVQLSFANSNVRYAQEIVPDLKLQNTTLLTGWKGEKVHAQLLVWSKVDVPTLTVSISDLQTSTGQKISNENSSVGFVEYVKTDEFKSGCGYRKPENFDSSLVADRINTLEKRAVVKPNKVQPVWVSINIPATVPGGLYSGIITIKADRTYRLKLFVKVIDKTLPPPSQWTFNLDLWQHPAAVARVHGVKLWSDEHYALLKKYYTLLARAGQKNITVSIVNEPWNHQTYDDYPGLIKWIKRKDGSWKYDYTLFDHYVSFVMSCGIRQRINCYSMVPWKIAFQ